jgi:integrase
MWVKTKITGVRYRESIIRKVCVKGKTRPDRCYYINYKSESKKQSTEKVGWDSEGIMAEIARDLRGQILANIRLGEGFQSIKEKREIEQARRATKRLEEEAKDRDNAPFEFIAGKYLEWAKENKKSWMDDEGRYQLHIKPIIGNIPINQISILTMEQLKKDLKRKRIKKWRTEVLMADATVKHCLVLVRQIFNRAKKWKLFEGENPVSETIDADRKFLKIEDNKRLRILSFKEAEILLNEIKNVSQQTHDICLVSFQTGMRMGEIFNLKWQDVDRVHGVMHIRNPKNNETRQAYITPKLSGMLKGLEVNKTTVADFVFVSRNGKKINQLSFTFNRAVDRLGLNEGVMDRQNKFVPHSLRHTFASWLAMQGETLLTIKELMGHKDIETTMRYAHLIPDQKRAAVMKLAL